MALPSTSTGSNAWTQAVQRRRAVEEHRVLVDDLLEHVPDLGIIESTIFLAALMFWTALRSTSRAMMNGLNSRAP